MKTIRSIGIKTGLNRRFQSISILLSAIFLLLGIFSHNMVLASVYHVSIHGDDSNTGNADKPFFSISRAAALCEPGDRVLVHAGVYREKVVIAASGRSEEKIMFQALDHERVVIDAAGKRHGIIIFNASHVVVTGFKVINSLRAGIHIHDHLDVDDTGSDFNVINDNLVESCGKSGYSGIYVGGHHNLVSGNTVDRSGHVSGGHGIYVLGNSNRISSNHVADSAGVGIRAEGENNIIQGNRILTSLDFGLTIWVDPPFKGKNISILTNVLMNNRRGGISVYGQGKGEKPENIMIYNNTVLNEQADFGIRVMAGSRRVFIKNNIVTGNYDDALLLVDAFSTAGFIEDFNIFFGSGRFCFRGLCYERLDVYRAASGNGIASRLVDPLLNADLSLSTESPAHNAGTDVGLPYVCNRPDIGAFENTEGCR